MAFEPARITEYGLFKKFWIDNSEHLSRGGLNEISRRGVEMLYDFALKHDLDGNLKPAAEQRIDDDERALIKHLMEHTAGPGERHSYSSYWEQDARPYILEKFGIPADTVHFPAHVVRPPVDAGDIEIDVRRDGSQVPEHAWSDIALEKYADLFTHEYGQRRAHFEKAGLSNAEKSLRALGLLKSYTDKMHTFGERDQSEAAGNALLDAFYALPSAKEMGKKDYNGFGVGVAQALVLGQEPNNFKSKYPDAKAEAPTTYLAMDGAMAPSMKYVDDYLKLLGKATGAEAHEKAPYLGYLVGDDSGHTKHGNLSEQRPFSSSGVNWLRCIFTNDQELTKLPVKEGFEFPIDCIDAYGHPIPCRPKDGERIEVRGKDGKALQVEKVVHKDEAGKAVSVSATFKDARGAEVAPADVTGVIIGANGTVKGDGKVEGSADMWWFGFCDRNAAQRLLKSRFAIPQLDRASIKIKAGQGTLVVPMELAQRLIDTDIPDIVQNQTFQGFRFDNAPLQVHLKNGKVIEGHLADNILEKENGPGLSKRVGSDVLAVHDAPGHPILGTVTVKTESGELEIDAAKLRTLTQTADGKVTIDYTQSDDTITTVKGELMTKVPWNKAEVDGTSKVLKQDKRWLVRGELTIDSDGTKQKIACSDVHQIMGEVQTDMSFSRFATYVAKNEGVFATDSAKNAVVSNGVRWITAYEPDATRGDDRPPWVSETPTKGIHGALVRKANDTIVYARGLYDEGRSVAFSGWYQVVDGRIVNEGFLSGEPDFAWGANGPIDWKAKSSFNPHMPWEMRLALFVNGVKDQAALKKMADAGNLPRDWKKYLVAQDEAPAVG
jgi:hypothetical protein